MCSDKYFETGRVLIIVIIEKSTPFIKKFCFYLTVVLKAQCNIKCYFTSITLSYLL